MVKRLIFIFLSVLLFCVCSFSFFSIPSSPLINYKILIDAGHGGIDNGVYGIKTNVSESQINLEIANFLGKELEKIHLSSVFTRTTDDGLYGDFTPGFKLRDMNKRKEIALTNDVDGIVSIHCNASTFPNCSGIVIYYNKQDEKSIQMAKCVKEQIESFNLSEKKVRLDSEEKFMTTKIGIPAILIECGFLSTQSDESKLISNVYQKRLARAISLGVFQAFYS